MKNQSKPAVTNEAKCQNPCRNESRLFNKNQLSAFPIISYKYSNISEKMSFSTTNRIYMIKKKCFIKAKRR
jgi:hypothetical protein